MLNLNRRKTKRGPAECSFLGLMGFPMGDDQPGRFLRGVNAVNIQWKDILGKRVKRDPDPCLVTDHAGMAIQVPCRVSWFFRFRFFIRPFHSVT